MSGLVASLQASVKALNAHSRSIEIVGKNLANVNNPAYARQRVMYGDRGTVLTPQGAESLGMEALGVQQLRDALVDRQVMREIGLNGAFVAEQRGYQRGQAALGETVDRLAGVGMANSSSSGGIAAALDDFFNAFHGFAANPTSSGERQMVLEKAGILAERFRLADQRIGQVQSDLNAEITTDVASINRLLSSVAELNGQIVRFEVGAPGSAVDLRDQRQARLEELAALLPVDVHETSGGSMDVAMPAEDGSTVLLVSTSTVHGAVSFDGNQLTGGSPAVVMAVASGTIRGALDARDGAIQQLRDNLDALSAQLVSSVNAAYNADGLSGDFFSASGTTAANIAVRPGLTAAGLQAGDGSAAGDNRRALAVAALQAREFSVAAGDGLDGTLSEFFSAAVSRLGQALASTNARVEEQSRIEELVRSQRDAVSGTSLDEEMADLLKYQRAFQASSRVFNAMDELLELVVNRLGRA